MTLVQLDHRDLWGLLAHLDKLDRMVTSDKLDQLVSRVRVVILVSRAQLEHLELLDQSGSLAALELLDQLDNLVIPVQLAGSEIRELQDHVEQMGTRESRVCKVE